MRSLLLLSAFALLGLFVAPGLAQACDPHSEICLGQTCNTGAADMVGVTTMDGDQKNLIACLKNDAGGFTWKSMSGGDSPSGTVCGFGNMQWNWGLLIGASADPCNGADVVNSCPSGYTRRSRMIYFQWPTQENVIYCTKD